MPGGASNPNSSPYFKKEGGEWSHDALLRGKVQIAAVSAGLVLPVDITAVSVSITAIRVNNTVSDPVLSSIVNAGDIGGGYQYDEGDSTNAFTGTINLAEAPSNVARPLQLNTDLDLKVAQQGTLNASIVGGSVGVNGTVNVSNQHTVTIDFASTPVPVSIRGGSTNQDVRIAAVSLGIGVALPISGNVTVNNATFDVNVNGTVPVSGEVTIANTPLPVSIRGGSTNQDVRLAAVSSVTVPVSFGGTAIYGYTVLSTSSSGTETVVSAPGSSTAIEIRGFSIYNESTNSRRFELRFGSTAFWKGGVPNDLAFNWNMVNHYVQSANNKALIAYINGAGTAVITVYYKEI